MTILTLRDVGFLGAVNPPKLFLDVYTGASAAYSLRQLAYAYTGPVVRVRRSSDNTEQNFYAAQVTDGTLAAFCGVGDGFVRTWYDQSGNGLHLTQLTTANQPQLVTSGVVDTEGGKPCIRHTATTKAMAASVSYSSNFHSVFKVARITGAGDFQRILTIVSEQAVLRRQLGGFHMYGAGMNLIQSGSFPATRILLSGIWLHTLGDMFAYSNGVNVITNTTGAGATASPTQYAIGGVATESLIGNVQEVIVYAQDQRLNRAAIESAVNSYYSIY